MKQALVDQGMYREQDNSHLEWPDPTVSQCPACVPPRGLAFIRAASTGLPDTPERACRSTGYRHDGKQSSNRISSSVSHEISVPEMLGH